MAGLAFEAGPTAIAEFWNSRVQELEEKQCRNQETIIRTDSELRAMKVELIDRLGLKPDTPFLDIFEQADLAFGTTIVAEILTGMAPRLKEAGKVSHDAGDAVIRAATAEFLSDL